MGVRSIAQVNIAFRVPRTAFRPMPRVDSSVVQIKPIHPPPLSVEEEISLRNVTRAVFQWRRKQIQKTFRDHGDLSFSGEFLNSIIRETGWDLTRRPETFNPEEFVRLSRLVQKRLDETSSV